MSYLEIKNLTKTFGKKTVLDHFSCSLEQGEILCLIGDSGSGKTTFLRLLNFLEEKDEGTVTLNGVELQGEKMLSKKEKALRATNFGMVFQSYNLFPQYTAIENVLLPLKTQMKRELSDKRFSSSDKKKEYNIRWKEKLQEADDLFSAMNLLDKKNSYPHQLSGGEAQRVAIIRALILNPKILCFDEPTSALDPKLKKEVANTILALKKQGRTIITVTHEMELAMAISDKVVFLENGKVIEQGSKEIVLTPKSEELKTFLSLEPSEEKEHVRKEDAERSRALGTLFSLSQD